MNKKVGWLAFLLAVPVAAAQRFGYPSSFGGGGSYFGYGGGGLDLLNVYSQYTQFFDFLIFFMIFSGIARMVFSKMFQGKDTSGLKALYVGLGLALSLGGVFYGYLSLETFGSFALPLGILLVGVSVFGLVRMVGGSKVVAAILAILVLTFMLPLLASLSNSAYAGNLLGFIPSGIFNWILVIGAIAALGFIIFSAVRHFGVPGLPGGRNKLPSGGPVPSTLREKKPWRIWPFGGGSKDGSVKNIEKSHRKAMKGYKKAMHFTEEGYEAFSKRQYNMLTQLARDHIPELIETAKTEGLKSASYEGKKKTVQKLLGRMIASSRYQIRMERRVRKILEDAKREYKDTKDVESLCGKLESDLYNFRRNLIDMRRYIQKDDLDAVGKIYGSIRNIFTDTMNNFRLLLQIEDNMAKGFSPGG